MTWSAQDDGAESNPRVMRLEQGDFMRKALGFGDPYLQRGVAWGFLSLLSSWSGKHFTDLHFPEFMVRRVAGPHAEWVVKAWQSAGLVGKKVKGRDGDVGWQVIDNGDQLINVLTKEQAEARRKKGVSNSAELAARLRDGDQCRYCAAPVRFRARHGWMRGTYLPEPGVKEAHREHPDPGDRDRIVVACGQCNLQKGAQTPQEWGRPLLPVPAEPLYNEDTLDLFRRHGITDIAAERQRVLAWLGDGSPKPLVSSPEQRQRVPVLSPVGPGREPGQNGPSGADLRPVRDDEPGGAA